MSAKTSRAAPLGSPHACTPLVLGVVSPGTRVARGATVAFARSNIRRVRCLFSSLMLACSAGCGEGSTGSGTVDVEVAFQGVETQGGSYRFITPLGYVVELSEASLWVGAVYANELVPTPGSQELPCVLPGIYVLEATQGLWIDALDAHTQVLPTPARAIQERGRMVELWLKSEGVDINAADDAAVVATYVGRASRDESSWSFRGEVSIGRQRRTPDPDPTRPGANPICKERIVRGLPLDFTPSQAGSLVVAVDPAIWFAEVNFAELNSAAASVRTGRGDENPDMVFEIEDDNTTQAGLAVFRGIRSAAAYQARWR